MRECKNCGPHTPGPYQLGEDWYCDDCWYDEEGLRSAQSHGGTPNG